MCRGVGGDIRVETGLETIEDVVGDVAAVETSLQEDLGVDDASGIRGHAALLAAARTRPKLTGEGCPGPSLLDKPQLGMEG